MPFSDIADRILGPKYELSLVFCGHPLSRRLNRDRRGIDKPTNILSFPLDREAGEIFLDLDLIAREYREKFAEFFPRSSASVRRWTAFLFIHGCLHLKGMDHGDKMESEEQRYFKLFLDRQI